jgi:hypothetical protein
MASLPENITRDHLLQAIEQVDQQGIPSVAKSQFYDLLHNGRRYPPKLIVSWANKFANGEILDRNSFSGGKDTPCFNLLEGRGFLIVPKPKRTMENRAKIYEFKKGVSDRNSTTLQSPEGKYIYWNVAKFNKNEPGDFIFFVNRYQKFAIFSKLAKTGIKATYDSSTNKSYFNHEYSSYEVEGEWDEFVRFDIIEKVSIPEEWNWTRQLGQSETYDLWKPKIKDVEKRVEKVDDLLKVFNEGEAEVRLLEIKNALLGNPASNGIDISIALSSDWVKMLMHSSEFVFANGAKLLEEVEAFDADSDFFNTLRNDFVTQTRGKDKGFVDFLDGLSSNSKEYQFILLAGQLIAHLDYRAANKKEWNTYSDTRVLAESSVRQSHWVEGILNFKVQNNNIDALNKKSVQNALQYLKDPQEGSTMLSEKHRALVSKHIFKQSRYRADHFINDLVAYFKDYDIEVENEDNRTAVLSSILYHPSIEKLWNVNKKNELSINGLIASDNTGWQDRFIEVLAGKEYDAAVVWWDKRPTGTDETISELKKKIKTDKAFDFYFSAGQNVNYKASVIDFSLPEEYPEKNWNIVHNIYEFEEDFNQYRGEGEWSSKKARIVYLIDHIEKLDPPLSMEAFKFYKGHTSPTQNNVQPFVDIISTQPKVTNLSNKEILQHVHQYILGKGFYFDYADVANFYLSLKTKPFVILAGISGTGKTQLVRKFAEAIGYKHTCNLIPVKPDWTDNSDLIGYLDLQQKFHAKKALKLIKEAKDNPNTPFFLVLDEMNLARVEYYFSDFLSIIETRERGTDNRISTDPILKENELGIDEESKLYRGIFIPDNLYVIGTVNMDETTHPFSRKVLDRANSIEMNRIKLDWGDSTKEKEPISAVFNDFLKTEYLNSNDLSKKDKQSLSGEIELLKAINEILEKADLHFAYRVRDEVAFYLLNNKKHKLLDNNQAIDYQIMQKVLPRIQGSSPRVEQILKDLLKMFNKQLKIDDKDTYDEVAKAMETVDEKPYPMSTEKLLFMLKRFDDDGFTSFWQ